MTGATDQPPDDRPEAAFSGRVGGERGTRRAAASIGALLVVALVAVGVLGRTSSDTSAPSRSAAPIDEATESPIAAIQPSCDPVDPTGPVPRLRLGAADDEVGVRGLLGNTRSPGAVTSGRGWQVPGPELALDLASGADIRLILGTGDCLRDAVAEAAPADLGHVPTRTERRGVTVAYLVTPVRSIPLLIELPDGDWVVRVVAQYDTGAGSGSDPDVSTEQYFRVRIGEGPWTEIPPTPLVTPYVECAFFVSQGGVGARLRVGSAEPVFGGQAREAAPAVELPLGEPVSIRLDGDGCAVAWDIELIDPATGALAGVLESVANPDGDGAVVAQNRWSIDVPLGDWFLHIRYHTSRDGPWLDAWWRIHAASFAVPEIRVAVGSAVVETAAYCPSIKLANGYETADLCSAADVRDIPTLLIAADSAIAFRIDGWTIDSWFARCGPMVAGPSGEVPFEPDPDCWNVSGVGEGTLAAPPPGEWAGEITISAHDAVGDRFSSPYYVVFVIG